MSVADLADWERDALRERVRERERDVCPQIYDKRQRCAGRSCRYRYHYLPDLIVNCLPADVSANGFKQKFERYGTVIYASVQPTDKHKLQFEGEQTGFLHFSSHEHAQRAIDAMNQYAAHSKAIPLKVTWTDKSKGARFLEAQRERSRERHREKRNRSRSRERKDKQSHRRSRSRSRSPARTTHFPFLHRHRNTRRSPSPRRDPHDYSKERKVIKQHKSQPEFQSFPNEPYVVPDRRFHEEVQKAVKQALINMGVNTTQYAY